MTTKFEESVVALQTTPVVASTQTVRKRITSVALSMQMLMLTGIVVIAVFLRAVNLDDVGFNSDEAVYAGQAAAIAKVPVLSELFPVFRAHPLLFQFTLAVFYKFDTSDLTGRLVSVAIGVATVLLVFLLGRRLYSVRAGLIAALLLAVMPYHIIPTRQVLLDGPMTLMVTMALFMVVHFAETERPVWLLATGVCMGLTFLAKETGILLVGAIYAFLALSPEIRVQIRTIIASLVLMVLTMVPFPLALQLAGGGGQGKTQQYLVWQLFRRPNHDWDFYFTLVPSAIGIGVIAAALWGLWVFRSRWSWRERLLLVWIVVPVAFFQVWPTKGFQYLLPTAVPFAILAGRTLASWPMRNLQWRRLNVGRRWLQLGLIAALTLWLSLTSWQALNPVATDSFLAGSGGVSGGRELGAWIRSHVPEGANMLTIGPSMANIVKYYGHRQAYGLSVSPNPLHRNPSYQPVINPDFRIRTSDLQYLVWDSYSAQRSPFFSEALRYYAEKYGGRVVYTATVTVQDEAGAAVEKPVFVVYEVHPQW
jgi:4-amino-4-deoxy-L-arabinose transferase-like glycosyltransferase